MRNRQSQLIEKTKEVPPVDSAKIDQVPIRFWKVVSPNTTSFFVVIDSLCRVGKLDVALGLFKDMIMLDMVPNIQIYNSLIIELCHSDRLDESYTVLVDMKNRGISPTQYTYNSILGC